MINSQTAVDFVKKCIMIKTVKTVFTVLHRQKTVKKYGLLTVRKKKPKMKPLKIRFFDGLKKKTDKKPCPNPAINLTLHQHTIITNQYFQRF